MIKPKISITTPNYETFSNQYLFSEKQKISRKMMGDFSSKRFHTSIKEISLVSLTNTKFSKGKEPIATTGERLIKIISLYDVKTSHNHPFVEKQTKLSAVAINTSNMELQLESEAEVIGLQKVKNILKNINVSAFKNPTHKDYKKILIEEVFTDISLSKISIKFEMSRASVLPAIFSLSVKPVIFKTNIKSQNYYELQREMKPKIKLDKITYPSQTRLEISTLKNNEVGISKNLQNKFNKKDEILSDSSKTFFLRSPLTLLEKPSKNRSQF